MIVRYSAVNTYVMVYFGASHSQRTSAKLGLHHPQGARERDHSSRKLSSTPLFSRKLDFLAIGIKGSYNCYFLPLTRQT